MLLLVVAAVGAAFAWQRRQALPAPPQPYGDPHDLNSLGLTAARPVGPAPDAGGPHGRRVPLPAVPSEPVARAVSGPRETPPASGPWAGPAVTHLLASLAAHVGGPVAVIRHDGERYQVEARTDGGARAPIAGRPLALEGPMDLGAGVLGGLSALVSGAAHAVPLGDHVLLIGGEGDSDGTAGYLDLLATLVPDLDATAVRSATSEAEDHEPDEAEIAEAAPMPRAAVIAQEQQAAQEDGRPLAFALVTLADAEERLTAHTVTEVARAERDLRDRLEAASDLRRLEPFGDLLFGVFLDLDPEGAAAWCDRLASGDPPLFIGAVAPAAGDPAGIRAAAVDALRDAYDQRRTRVVEA